MLTAAGGFRLTIWPPLTKPSGVRLPVSGSSQSRANEALAGSAVRSSELAPPFWSQIAYSWPGQPDALALAVSVPTRAFCMVCWVQVSSPYQASMAILL